MTGLVPLVTTLQGIAWEWTKTRMKKIASELGLTDPSTGSHRYINYASPSPEFPAPDPEYPGKFLNRPYGFTFDGEQVLDFHVHLAAVDMGEVYLEECERYYDVYERKNAEFEAAFKKAAKQITSVVGKPIFLGRPDDAAFAQAAPVGWSSDLIAVWRLDNARLILVYGQQDKELPIVLELYVCPPLV